MRENPRPTRHLEQLETAQLGKLAPGSVSGPAWDLVALPGPPDGGATEAPDADDVVHSAAPVAPAVPVAPPAPFTPAAPVTPVVPVAPAVRVEPAAPPASVTSPAVPGASTRGWTMVAVGCGVLAAFALGIGGLSMLWADRPEAEITGPVEHATLDLPLIPADDPHDASEGERAEARLRDADDAEAGEPREDGADGADASSLGDGTVSSGDRPDQSGEGVPGAGTGTGGSGGSGGSGSDPGSGAGGGTGTGGGGTTPTSGPPRPTPDPTTEPTAEPTPKPTPTASDEPTPEPTPTPSVSPSPTPTGAPVSPNTGG